MSAIALNPIPPHPGCTSTIAITLNDIDVRTTHLPSSQFSYTVDLSKSACGCNSALYAVSMPAYKPDGVEPDPTENGDYYCDANGVGGHYCPEMVRRETEKRE